MKDRRQRAVDKIRTEAYRLGFDGQCADAADLEKRLVAAGFDDVPEALAPIHDVLDGLCRDARKPRGKGIAAMFDHA